MARLELLTYPDPRLHLVATPVVEINDDIRKLVQEMEQVMREYNGVGLAATQVNVQKRVIIMDLSAEDEPKNLLVFINPEIISKNGEVISEEGCLSVPGVYEKVPRAEKISLRYLDLDGNKHEIECTGLLAVCVQHETDHLNGRVYVEYLSSLKQNFILKKLKKLKRVYKPE